MKVVGESRFFEALLKEYPYAPSIALCRVPELELLSQVQLIAPVLDHCCGDGLIAAMAFPGRRIEAGVDFSRRQLARAAARGAYAEARWADAGVRLPFEDACFGTVFNNSGIEHIENLGTALSEVNRVLRRGGRLYLTVLNSRYFDWWPLEAATAAEYRAFQPYHTVLDETGWTEALGAAGFEKPEFTDYFVEDVARLLARLDYAYSSMYLKKRPSVRLIAERMAPRNWVRRKWRGRFSGLRWDAPAGAGGGFMIAAQKPL